MSTHEATLRERFEAAGYSVSKYARKVGVDPAMVVRVLDGRYQIDWRRSPKYRKLMRALRDDGVYAGRLPWEAEL